MKELVSKFWSEDSLSKPKRTFQIDWALFCAAILISLAGLFTMNSFTVDKGLFSKQLISFLIAIIVFFIFSFVDFRFLKKTRVIFGLFLFSCAALISLFVIGHVAKGAQSWLKLGFFSIQPSDPIKLIVILILAKYFNRRHMEIAYVRHILVSGLYAFVIFALILIQPDFGTAIIIFMIWLGMVLVSGISKKHLFSVFIIGLISFFVLWSFVFQNYQKQRIMNFVNPLRDIRGSGYNAYQSTIAIGSGRIMGKGIGYGTQSRLQFLPEYQTDFIFAAFAEEWGFVGVTILLGLYSVVIWRILANATHGNSNFEILFGAGLSIIFMAHIIVHVGGNVGLLPVTGTTIPFMSYGGSHLLTEFAGLGILMGMRRYSRAAHKDMTKNEFLGI